MTYRLLALVCMALWFMAVSGCGGGSGGGTSPPPAAGPGPGGGNIAPPPGSGGSGAGSNPPTAPPLPVLAYDGSVSSPTLTDQNVGAFADLIYDAAVGGIELADFSVQWSFTHLPEGVDSVTVPGPDGGSMTLTQHVNEDGTGWNIVDYEYFRDDQLHYHGRVVLELQSPNVDRRISFHELEFVNERGEFVYHGTLQVQRTAQPGGRPDFIGATGSLLVENRSRGYQMFSEDLQVQRNPIVGGVEIDATGRIYHSEFGWLDYEFETPWTFESGFEYPVFGGTAIGRNGTGHELRVEILDREYVSLQYPSASPAVLDRATRQVWPWLFEWQTLRPGVGTPVADAGPNLVVDTNEAVALSPLYSTHTYTRFLAHHWRVLYRPPHSTAEIDGSNAIRPIFTPDLPGRYLIELLVDDGNATDSSVVAITAIEGVKEFQHVPPAQAQLVRGQTANVGENVQIDRTRYRMRALAPNHGHAPPSIAVNAPVTDWLQTSQTPEALSFLPEHRGVYEVILGRQAVGNAWPLDVAWVAVDAEIPFHPPAWFETNRSPVDIAIGDMNGNGIDDFVLALAGPDNHRLVEVVYNAAQGGYSSRISFEADARALTVGDLNSSGRLDIAIATLQGIEIYTQAENGEFVFSAALTNETSWTSPGELQVGDINGDGRLDLLKPGPAAAFAYALQQPDGTLAPFQTFHTGLAGTLEFKVGDLNDDGVADVVITFLRQPGIPQTVGVVYGQIDGPPIGPVMLPYDGLNDRRPVAAIGDLTGDGRNELIFATSQRDSELPGINPYLFHIHIYRQAENGSLIESEVIDANGWIWQLQVGDFDHDGYGDILQVGTEVRSLGLRSGRPDGGFAPLVGFEMSMSRNVNAGISIAGDFNGNGLTDIAYGQSLSPVQGIVGILFGVAP